MPRPTRTYNPNLGLNRRQFLRLSAVLPSVALGSATLGSVAAQHPQRAFATGNLYRAMALSAPSPFHPTLAGDWQRALQNALPSTWQMLGADGAAHDLHAIAHLGTPPQHEGNARLVQADFGARFLADGDIAASAASLYQWQANWALGRWLAQHIGQRGYLVMSFYESGYDTPFAFQTGYESAGGQLLGSRVVDAPIRPLAMSEVMTELRQARPNMVYVLLQDPLAQSFFTEYRAANLLGKIALAGSPFALRSAMQTLGAQAAGMHSWRTWRNVSVGPLTALARRTAQQLLGPVDGDALSASIYLTQAQALVGQSQLGLTSVARLGAVRDVPPLPFIGPRSGWSQAYLGV